MKPTERKIKTAILICLSLAHCRCFSTAGKDAVEETVCLSVLRLWQAVCSENGKPGDHHQSSPMHWEWESYRAGAGAGMTVPLGQALESGGLGRPLEKTRRLALHPHSCLHGGQGHGRHHVSSPGYLPCSLQTSSFTSCIGSGAGRVFPFLC